MRRPAAHALAALLTLTACVTPRAHAPRRRPPAAPVVDLRAGVDASPLEQLARTQRFGLGRPARFTPTPDGSAVLFLRAPEGGAARALWAWERATGQERALVTAESLLGGAAESLSPEERARRERQRVSARGIASYELSPDGQRVLVPLSGRLFVYERSTGASRELGAGGAAAVDARWSPDGRHVSAVRGGELHVFDAATGEGRALTRGATEDVTHAVAEFVAQEELDRMEGYWWSPDSDAVLWQETDLSSVERLRVADPSRPERAPEALAYPRAGTPNASLRLGLTPLAPGAATRWITWDRARYPYLVTVRWQRNAPLTLVVMTRAQDDVAVLAVSPGGVVRELFHERDEAWVNTRVDFPRWRADGRAMLWATERDGAWRLERRDADGQNPTWVTPADLGLRGLVHVDDAHETLWVTAGDDPTGARVARVRAADGAVTWLDDGAGEHGATVARDGSLVVRESATLDAPPRVTVLDGEGRALGDIASLAERPAVWPRVELREVGAERFRAAIVRPRTFSPARRWPVIVWVYGGPHSRMVTRAAQRYVTQQWLADQGFVVVMFDGRGTQARGRAWERALRGALGDVPLDDQARALAALGADDSSLDLGRVGVIGWSFGGYLAARAVMARPEVFHAAVAGAPVTEWREYDTCYTERYLGLPDDARDAYDRASLLPLAPALRRPLMLVHGTVDDNVYLHNSLRLADALLRAGRRVDFVPLAGQTHLVHEPELSVAWLLRARGFFVEHLRPGA